MGLLDGRVALVTGASRGIGRAIAEEFSKQGARVATLARSAAEPPVDGISLHGDVGSAADVEAAFTAVEGQLGPVDILINNAAVLGPPEHVTAVDPEAWFKTYRTNVYGPLLCARRALPSMMRRRAGKIVNVSSGAALAAIAGYTAYSSSKAALLHLSVCLAEEVKPYGINVNVVGVWARTDMWEDQLMTPMPAVAEAIGQRLTPSAEENVGAILFLASSAANHVTGQYLAANSLPAYAANATTTG